MQSQGNILIDSVILENTNDSDIESDMIQQAPIISLVSNNSISFKTILKLSSSLQQTQSKVQLTQKILEKYLYKKKIFRNQSRMQFNNKLRGKATLKNLLPDQNLNLCSNKSSYEEIGQNRKQANILKDKIKAFNTFQSINKYQQANTQSSKPFKRLKNYTSKIMPQLISTKSSQISVSNQEHNPLKKERRQKSQQKEFFQVQEQFTQQNWFYKPNKNFIKENQQKQQIKVSFLVCAMIYMIFAYSVYNNVNVQ